MAPFSAALLNAIVGLVSPYVTITLFLMLAHGLSDNHSGTNVVLPVSMFVAGAIVGLLACWGLLKGTSGGSRRRAISCLPVVAAFGVGLAFMFTVGIALAITDLAFVAMALLWGASMSGAMARAARNFGATPFFAPWMIAALGGILAPIALALIYMTTNSPLYVIFPALWLGVVTYFCLKQRTPRQTSGTTA